MQSNSNKYTVIRQYTDACKCEDTFGQGSNTSYIFDSPVISDSPLHMSHLLKLPMRVGSTIFISWYSNSIQCRTYGNHLASIKLYDIKPPNNGEYVSMKPAVCGQAHIWNLEHHKACSEWSILMHCSVWSILMHCSVWSILMHCSVWSILMHCSVWSIPIHWNVNVVLGHIERKYNPLFLAFEMLALRRWIWTIRWGRMVQLSTTTDYWHVVFYFRRNFILTWLYRSIFETNKNTYFCVFG